MRQEQLDFASGAGDPLAIQHRLGIGNTGCDQPRLGFPDGRFVHNPQPDQQGPRLAQQVNSDFNRALWL